MTNSEERQAMLEKCVFEVRIKSKDINIDVKNLDYTTAFNLVKNTVEAHPDDQRLQETWAQGQRSFGYYGSGGGGFDYHVSADMPRIKTEEKQRCGRRDDMFNFRGKTEDSQPDHWDKIGDDRICSYCGSLHPDDLISLIEKHGPQVISGTDKGYKFYIRNDGIDGRKGIINAGMGAIKFYTQHLTADHRAKLKVLMETVS